MGDHTTRSKRIYSENVKKSPSPANPLIEVRAKENTYIEHVCKVY